MNHLLIDIGNSCLHVAAQLNSGGLYPMVSVLWQKETEGRAAIETAWQKLPADQPRSAVIGSVNPDRLEYVRKLLSGMNIPLKVIRDEIPLPMTLEVDNPDTVGVDRICSAAAAFEVIKGPVVVASFGTAITVDAVSGDGVFLGGAIFPGFHSQAQALHQHTALLPEVEIKKMGRAIGRNTQEAIQSGILYGVVGALRELIEQFAEKLGEWPMVIVTGGGAPLVMQTCNFVDRHVEDLTLRGLKLAAEKWEARPKV